MLAALVESVESENPQTNSLAELWSGNWLLKTPTGLKKITFKKPHNGIKEDNF